MQRASTSEALKSVSVSFFLSIYVMSTYTSDIHSSMSAYFLNFNNIMAHWFKKKRKQHSNLIYWSNSSLKACPHCLTFHRVCLFLLIWVCEWTRWNKKRAREREREGVLTGRKRAKVQAAHVSGSTSPLRARWKTCYSHRFLQPGLAPPHLWRWSFLAGGAIFISVHGKF